MRTAARHRLSKMRQGVAMVGTGVIAYAMRHSTIMLPLRYWVAIIAGSLIFLTLKAAMPRDRDARLTRHLWLDACALAATAALLVIAAYLLKVSDGFSRLWAAYWAMSAWLGVAFADARASGSNPRRIMVAGPGNYILLHEARLGAGACHDIAFKPLGEMVQWLNQHEALDGLVDEIIVVGPVPSDAERSALILALHGNPVELRYCVDLGELIPDGWANGILGQPTVPLAGFQPWGQRVVKRSEDLVLTILGLPILLPVMAVVGLMVRLGSPGPIFFRQRRLGLGGKAFTILKFRTMATDASGDVGAPQALAADNRITAVGHFLRRSGLDELPQVFNVLKGEMSLVGPRPHAFPHDVLWSELVRGYTRRFEMKPGITGLAQIRGYHGFVDDERTINARLALDLEYIGSWSLLLDLRILARTLLH